MLSDDLDAERVITWNDFSVGSDHIVLDLRRFNLDGMNADGVTYLEKNGTLALVDDLDPGSSLLGFVFQHALVSLGIL